MAENLFNKPDKGPFVCITKGDSSFFYVPYTEAISFSTSHTFFQPVQQFFEKLHKVITTSTKLSFGVIAQAVSFGSLASDILGIQYFNKYYYGQAWKGTKPGTFTLTLSFFMGMLDKWDGNSEVYTPIQALYSQTLPSEGQIGALFSPAPTALDVFTKFATYTITGGGDAKETKDNILGALNLASNNLGTISKAFSSSKTWTVRFGLGTKVYLVMSDLVCTEATFKFENRLDSNGYPISGTISFTFTTQAIPISNTTSMFTG
jgi:hypothetical protein